MISGIAHLAGACPVGRGVEDVVISWLGGNGVCYRDRAGGVIHMLIFIDKIDGPNSIEVWSGVTTGPIFIFVVVN